MYGSFFCGSYGVKFLKGESAAARCGAAGAFDLVFIGSCAESLDCLTGDFFRGAGGALLSPGRVAGAFARSGPGEALAAAGALLRGLPLAVLAALAEAFAEAFATAAAGLADFAAGFLALAAGWAALAALAAVLRAVARAEDLLAGAVSVAFLPAAFRAEVRWLPVPWLFVLVLPAAVLFTAAFFLDVVALPLPFAFVVVAAMICLW